MNTFYKCTALFICLFFSDFSTLAVADEYYSSSDAWFKGSDKVIHLYQLMPGDVKGRTKSLIEERKVSIQFKDGQIKFSEKTKFPEEMLFLLNPEKPGKLSENLSSIVQFFLTKENQDTFTFLEKKMAKPTKTDEASEGDKREFDLIKSEIKKLRNLQLYNLQYLLTDTQPGTFLVKTGSYYYYIQAEEKVSNGVNIFDSGIGEIRTVEYKILKALHSVDGVTERVTKFPEILLIKKMDNEGRLLGFQILRHSFFYVCKVVNEQLTNFVKELSERVTEVKEFSFSKDTLFITYLENKENEEKRLFVEYKMSGKKKNIIQVNMKAPVSLFDPDNISMDIEENIGFLGDVKGKDLVEMKKTQLINDQIDTKWVNNLNLPVLSVVYKVEDGWDKKLWSKSEEKRYLGIEGLWYMVSWMNRYNMSQKKITFLNGSVATDFTIYNSGRESNGDNIFEFVKMEKVVYRFTLDRQGFVRKFEFPAENQVVTLEEIENTTTRKNKEYLRDYISQNNIVLIKDVETSLETFFKNYKF